MENLTPEQMKMYETSQPPDFNTPFAWARRRRGAWVPTRTATMSTSATRSAARSLKSIFTHSETALIPLPNPEAHQPYQIGVDKEHNVWTNLWSTDKVAKYNPSSGQWTLFELPTRGTESRHISLLERNGQPLRVIIPYERAGKLPF